jgi:branched-subunit amino acid transport protein
MGAALYLLRLSGLALPELALPPAWERGLSFLPIALLTALVVSSLTRPGDVSVARLVAAAGAVGVARVSGRMWACILGGLALYWLLRLGGTVA